MISIPFNKPFLVGKELFYIAQSVLSGKISGDGIFSRRCHEFLEKQFNAKRVLLTTSCTSALEMAAILFEIEPGDEVILPSYTFVSTANAFYLRGARLVFVDIRPDTLNINEQLIERAVTQRTKAIVPVHYAGVGCEMDMIMDVAKKHDLWVVEDAAQGVNARYRNRYLGTIGHLGTYSFHETKNFICGEGGAIVINDERFVERAEIIREKGTNRSKFFRGEIDKYTWVDIGSSYLISDILAAFLYPQLENMETITDRRRKIFFNYANGLLPLAKDGDISIPNPTLFSDSNYHMYYILLENEKTRDQLMAFLKENGALSVFHYIPLHLSPVGIKMGYGPNDLPVTESISGRLLRLPFYFELTENEQKEILKLIFTFFNKKP